MKLDEVLNENWGAGASSLVTPGAFTGQQVVQPITRQAFDIGQTHFNDKAKEKKPPKGIDVEDYNDIDIDQLTVHYEFADNKTAEQFKKMLNKIKGRLKTKERDNETK